MLETYDKWDKLQQFHTFSQKAWLCESFEFL